MTRVLVLLIALAVAGCGGEEATDDGGATAPAAEPAKSIEIVATDFQFDPSTIELPGSGTYEFVLHNEGEMQHALEIEGGDVEDETITIGPGQTAKVTVDLSEGHYELYCPVGDHRERGMEGDIVVGAGGGAGTTTDETETEDDDGY